VHAYFARHAANLQTHDGERVARVPGTDTVEAIIDAAFWASLRREEGYVPKISLAFLAPEETVYQLVFERPLRLDPSVLTRVGPAVERAGIHLGVCADSQGVLHVWGATRILPSLCLVVEVAAPGLIVVKNHSREKSGKFVNVAVLEGDQVKVVDHHRSGASNGPSVLTSLLGFDSPTSWFHSVNILVQLAVSMRAHGHGGSLLVVPSASDAWRDSIVSPIPYALSPPFTGLTKFSRQAPSEADPQTWQQALGRAVDAVAGLTAVDGAVVLTDRYEVLGFGAKITRRKGYGLVQQVSVTEPIEGGLAALVHPEQLGGTRHLSAAQFVQDQRDSVAFVASQDERFTIFEWRSEMVYAHRVESLLL
jgi:hypothetical protein